LPKPPEFKLLPSDRVMLTVLYRYHYYIEKALGNLLGLAQLLYFVAKETGLGVGPLLCHSTLLSSIARAAGARATLDSLSRPVTGRNSGPACRRLELETAGMSSPVLLA
jgi:hypothetical protein